MRFWGGAKTKSEAVAAAAAATLGCSGGARVNLCRAPVGFDLARLGEA